MKQMIKNLRKNQTDAERKMWRHLKNRSLTGYKFRRQSPIGPYIVDFACFEKMVVIEIDGGQHAVHAQKDMHRTKYLKSLGFNVIQFWNNEVLGDVDSVLSVIQVTLINSPSSPTLLPQGEGSSNKTVNARPEPNTRTSKRNISPLSHRERAGVRAKI